MHIHDKGVYHRDLKLDNIMLKLKKNEAEEEKIEELLLIDFGFAFQNKESDELRNICGTPNYMAPEIFKRQIHKGR